MGIRMKEWAFQCRRNGPWVTMETPRLGGQYVRSPGHYRWKHKRTGRTQPARFNDANVLLPPDDSDVRLEVHCHCGELVYDLAIFEDGSVLEPDPVMCAGCGSELRGTVDFDEMLRFYVDDGEFEDVLGPIWPTWAIQAFQDRRKQ